MPLETIPPGKAQTLQSPDHEVIAFRFASTSPRQPWQNYLQPDPGGEAESLDFLFFAIRNGERILLVDTGFIPAPGDARVTAARSPLDCLREAGIEPAQVTDVIITHLHWDHAGCLDEYPQATVHLQAKELAFVTGPCMCEPFLRRPFSGDDVASALRALYAGRLRLHEGDAEIAPGITLHHIGGHTEGLQAVRVSTARGQVVLASDAAHTWLNLRGRNPFPVLVNVADALRGFHTLEALADGPDHIIPGHDPRVARRFPRLPGTRDAVMLHLAPRESVEAPA
jgi:glyoxylase-like metal-dependent hydrolase (beta-lactamase superfamily II)